MEQAFFFTGRLAEREGVRMREDEAAVRDMTIAKGAF
jgi:hypothetical protein